MTALHRFIHGLFKLLFGDFNGIQVFLYPMTLFWWIDSDSFISAITGLLTIQRHLFPLCLFFLLLIYLAFLIVKNSSAIFPEGRPVTGSDRDSFLRMVIEVHKILLITIVSSALIYVVAAFLKYYYGILVPLKLIYPVVFRGFSILLILYYTLKNAWTETLREEGKSMETAFRAVREDWDKRPLAYAGHALALVLMIIIGSFLYNLIILNLLFPLVGVHGPGLKVLLIPPENIGALLYDVFIFGVSLMLSNLLFSPLAKVIMHYSDRFNPQTTPVTKEAEHAPEN